MPIKRVLGHNKCAVLPCCKRAITFIPVFPCRITIGSSPREDNGSGQINKGDADDGPRLTAMDDTSQHQDASGRAAFVCLSVLFFRSFINIFTNVQGKEAQGTQ